MSSLSGLRSRAATASRATKPREAGAYRLPKNGSAPPERFPIKVNAAPLPELLRIPGIGPTSAKAIVQARRQAKLRELGDLRKLGARADRAAPFVTLAGQRPPLPASASVVGAFSSYEQPSRALPLLFGSLA